ncbi:Spo0E family sporulation regulatory protein-aspartic acid phosphatase [Shouchella patagoniensis]|uniref:Spo0E family sporulation regulatory protein-aspartic acid phosphatase n=1 Tax=Shouchella patagoniensis TaxID=228576 RepID=UPI0009951AAF|nr:Spo0E family sporulation regulatory protein-aspartic acid phosphatase [Shouchella patagoniensis]
MKTTYEKLEHVRALMLQAVKQYGLSHPLVLMYSEEIDQIHNDILMIQNHKEVPFTKQRT